MSHPMWVRGLKQGRQLPNATRSNVAPYVGAWIETSWAPCNENNTRVAPYVGAWIETIVAKPR